MSPQKGNLTCEPQDIVHDNDNRLQKLRHGGDTLEKVFSPNLEKALTFLDDKPMNASGSKDVSGSRKTVIIFWLIAVPSQRKIHSGGGILL